MRRASRWKAAALGVAIVAATTAADAQVRWDVGAEAGVAQHVFTDRPTGAPAALPGPVVELRGDVAVLPMVRAGVHVAFDATPFDGLPPETALAGGLQVKVAPPLLASPWRTWLEVGVDYGWVAEGSHRALVAGVADAPGASGGLLALPVAVALAYRASHTWEPFVALGARFGVAWAGSLFAPPTCTCASPYLGRDAVALALTLGLNSNQ